MGQYSYNKLTTLSTSELIKLAEDFGIDIPPDLERIFIIEELLECTKTDEQDPKEEINIIPSYLESVALPKQYNFSYIDIIIRDPLWIYAFWEIKECDKESFNNSPNFNGYCLRVIPLNEDDTISKTRDSSFTIPIDTDDDARYLGFAEHSTLEASRYLIKLAAIIGEEEVQIAISQPFKLPRLITNEDVHKMKDNPLTRLSGVADLPIIINTDRSK